MQRLIRHDKTTLRLTEHYNLAQLMDIINREATVLWDFKGHVRVIPQHLVLSVYHITSDYAKCPSQFATPKNLDVIHWSACHDLPQDNGYNQTRYRGKPSPDDSQFNK